MAQIIHKPAKKKRSRLDHFMYAMALLGPIMIAPQVKNIWVDKHTAGVSFITWLTLTFVVFMWLLYSIRHKEKQLILYYVLALIMDVAVVVGLLLFH